MPTTLWHRACLPDIGLGPRKTLSLDIDSGDVKLETTAQYAIWCSSGRCFFARAAWLTDDGGQVSDLLTAASM